MFARLKQWKALNNCEEAKAYRLNTKNEKEWIWKRSLWFAPEKELRKILKKVNKKYVYPE